MSYISQSELKGLIPDVILGESMDDNADEAADAGMWDAVAAEVDDEINGRLESRYRVPIDPVPSTIRKAAKAIAIYLLYGRRQIGDDRNPGKADADYWKKRLDEIGRGALPLSWEAQSAESPATLIQEEAKTFDPAGRLMT